MMDKQIEIQFTFDELMQIWRLALNRADDTKDSIECAKEDYADGDITKEELEQYILDMNEEAEECKVIADKVTKAMRRYRR